MDEFENFDTKAFVGRLLGKGDWSGFMDKIKVLVLETIKYSVQLISPASKKACNSFKQLCSVCNCACYSSRQLRLQRGDMQLLSV